MQSGNTSKAGYSRGGPDKSFLFLLTGALTLESNYSEIGLEAWQRRLFLDRFGAPSMLLENPVACLIHTPVRTHHRIRSPRLAASSR